MDMTITPQSLRGSIPAVPSKSHAHRLLICGAFAQGASDIHLSQSCQDLEATVSCLCRLGTDIRREPWGYHVEPAVVIPQRAILPCGESGTTLRFLLPVAGALGIDATFLLKGRLHKRPLSPLWEEMERMGCTLTWLGPQALRCTGRLHCGAYTITGDVSSQFISGLYIGCSLLQGTSQITLTGPTESAPYVAMTRAVLSQFGASTTAGRISGGILHSPGSIAVEGDWSNGAFFLAANTLGSDIKIHGLQNPSCQGDRAVSAFLDQLSHHTTIDLTHTPDLLPVLAVVAAAKEGAVFQNIRRLRFKESDRVEAVAAMLTALGGRVSVHENAMEVFPCQLQGGLVDSHQDHRIAMAAAIAATCAAGSVTIQNAQCTAKSYPGFWADYRKLGGAYEQHIR